METVKDKLGKEKVHFNLARIDAGGGHFEVVVDAEKAIAFRSGQADIRDVLVYDKIFADAKKGLLASEHMMKNVFKTGDTLEVASQIISKGKVQVNSEYRERKREEKKRALVEIIHRTAIDPKTGFPHPQNRIEAALQEAKVRIDEDKSAEGQVQEVVKKLMQVLPLKFEVRKVEFHIPSKFAVRAYPLLKGYGQLVKDEWQGDGSLLAVVEVPAGLQQDLYSDINKLTHGDVESKIVGR